MHDRLAIDGGRPVRQAAAAPWPVFDEEMIEAAAAVMRSGRVNYWTGGETRAFEQEYASRLGRRYAVALANGSVALEAALAGLDIGAGDEVVVTCRSFVASASCCAIRGARPVFADVDRESQNVTAKTVAAALSPRTRAIIAVHLAGWPCEMQPIVELARRRGLAVIEDCAQAHGATYRGRPAGSLGDVAAFSFCQDKILTTGGEGGLLATDREDVWQTVWSLKDHGKNWHAATRRDPRSVFRWLHQRVGTNWRMTEIQGAIGRVMLRRLPGWVERRRQLAARLESRLAAIPSLRLATPPAHVEHAYYRYYAYVRPQMLKAGWSRDRIVQAIVAEGIPCGSGVCPEIYREEAFAHGESCPKNRLPVARELGETSLAFHVHPTLSRSDIDDTARAAAKVLRAATAIPQRRAA
ncbi:MAG: DegT/DnrJ/EryC1/StrS aminotransferase family protein [Pirellulales bacterium]|jgi:dTDP-4-amino-4,6-dideoxygalactose transaminase|nr:DegT/DnrJ/EryC1/StrS aminotransferase family protein [Thermoguttaceae bacterium]MDD4788565.1 DegT/DnrJ/EryC1/StrS aminotransferase family protein [Pirellulales bacterium]MDI9443432.1 DegT/DnrJ/EryC1/StrS aminotransferase family protein [Planctomycetota bacterium]NLZ00355.1 DegT/DnrJ/EryC1/StrS aminotransferase family protein [Pirellulaceae bacterium]